MRPVWRVLTAATTATAVALTFAPSASAHGKHRPTHRPITVVADGLEGPFQVSRDVGHRLLVMESGAGRVISVDPRHRGKVRTLVSGLGPNAASGAVRVGKYIAIVTGEADPSAPAGPYPGSSVLVAKKGKVSVFADLMAHELKYNPDGQTQFGPDGAPLDALSNPFSLLAERGRHGGVLVADGGANAVLRVSAKGKVSTFFVPPTVNTGACEGRPNNDASTVGCDAVPTGLAYGPRNTLYVSALTGEAPGEGRVYVLDARTGKVKRVIKGFTSPTGVAVRRDGTIYVSEVLEGMPEGEPGPGFDPSTVGQIVKVSPWGKRTYAQVTMPTGLVISGKSLYSTAWSIAGFLGIEGAGQVVKVSDRAFRRAS
ncbi:ScyD/ScyE family protein [Aeromicrobium sp. JJY06]|uniref:ScyD/ScyE family protein n=1 Tax=Aeromicrobium sp. JJY06 TaxID=3373478 RepID=UPI00376EBDD7